MVDGGENGTLRRVGGETWGNDADSSGAYTDYDTYISQKLDNKARFCTHEDSPKFCIFHRVVIEIIWGENVEDFEIFSTVPTVNWIFLSPFTPFKYSPPSLLCYLYPRNIWDIYLLWVFPLLRRIGTSWFCRQCLPVFVSLLQLKNYHFGAPHEMYPSKKSSN